MDAPPRRCPATGRPPGAGCHDGRDCPADPAPLLPRHGAERAVMLALRFVAAAAETGDAACYDAAFEGAEAALGPRDGALLVARAAALVRALGREGADLRSLPPPCRRLSAGEAALLAALRGRLSGRAAAADIPAVEAGLPAAARAALGDLAAPVRATLQELPWLPPVAAGAAEHRPV